jgi:hypothetical protein
VTAIIIRVFASTEDAFADFVGGADPLSRQGFRIVRRAVDGDLVGGTALDGAAAWPDGVLALDGSEADVAVPVALPALDLAHLTVINRAIGVLMDRGLPPEEALQVLHGQAAAARESLADWAVRVVASTRRGGRD